MCVFNVSVVTASPGRLHLCVIVNTPSPGGRGLHHSGLSLRSLFIKSPCYTVSKSYREINSTAGFTHETLMRLRASHPRRARCERPRSSLLSGPASSLDQSPLWSSLLSGPAVQTAPLLSAHLQGESMRSVSFYQCVFLSADGAFYFPSVVVLAHVIWAHLVTTRVIYINNNNKQETPRAGRHN